MTHRHLSALLSALLLLATAPLVAQADTTAKIVETQPAAPATLGRQENFWIHIAYETGEPVSLWARPYRDGVQVDALSNASGHYEDSGDALGWFALTKPGDVDEIRIIAGGGTPYHEWELARQTVQLTWGDTPTQAEPQAPWVTELLAADKARMEQWSREQASKPASASDYALLSGFMIAVVLFFLGGTILPAWAVWKWRGGWRVAAAFPGAWMAFVILRVFVDTTRDPTSHNLWPFEILQAGVMVVPVVLLLAIARWISGRTRGDA